MQHRVAVRRVRAPDTQRAQSLTNAQQLSLVGRRPENWPPPELWRGWRHYQDTRRHAVETAITNTSMLSILPGKEHGSPVRGEVADALLAGAPVVHVVLHDINDPQALPEHLAEIFDSMPLAVLLLSDVGQALRSTRNWAGVGARLLNGWGPALRANKQVAVFDLPGPRFDRWGRVEQTSDVDQEARKLRWAIEEVDAAAFAFTGPAESMRRHAWRSPAALAAGLLTAGGSAQQRLLDNGIGLGEGRKLDESRVKAFGVPGGEPWAYEVSDDTRKLVNPVRLEGNAALFEGQTMLREGWEIPAQRTLRQVHHALVTVAEQFVFRNAVRLEAIALEFALRVTLEEFEKRGLLTGVTGGSPTVKARPELLPVPSLVADIDARLRPWGTRVEVRFRVGGGALQEEN